MGLQRAGHDWVSEHTGTHGSWTMSSHQMLGESLPLAHCPHSWTWCCPAWFRNLALIGESNVGWRSWKGNIGGKERLSAPGVLWGAPGFSGWSASAEGHCCLPCPRWKALRVPHLPCPLHPERDHEDAHPAEAQRERPQIPVPALHHRHRQEERPAWVSGTQNFLYCSFHWHVVALSFPGGSDSKESACMQEPWVQSWDQEDPLEKEMETHSSIRAWRIPWTEEPGRLQSMGLQDLNMTEPRRLSLFTAALQYNVT